MAKKSAVSTKPAVKSTAPNLFHKAVTAPRKEKKEKGTVFILPKDVGEDNKLRGESLVLNNSVTEVITAKKEESVAKNKGNIAKGHLKTWMFNKYTQEWAANGMMPETPVSLANHLGESLTYVVVDKTQQYTLGTEQVELLEQTVGADTVKLFVETVDIYGFDPATMGAPAGEIPASASADEIAMMPTVQDVIFEIVSEAISKETRLTDEQKAALITRAVVTRVKSGYLARLAEFVGAKAEMIGQVLEIIGSGCTRYFN